MTGGDEGFWAALPLGKGVELLEHDRNGVGALAKPDGVLSHPNKEGEESRSLLKARYSMIGEYFEWSSPLEGAVIGGICGVVAQPLPPRRLYLLNRLDSATSGVILAASNETLAGVIREQFKRKEVSKAYLAVVFGKVSKPTEMWRDRLSVEKGGGKIRTSSGHIPAESLMSVVRSGAHPGSRTPVSLIRLEPRTGRSHQLRVQCARRGIPIVGDQTYGDFARNRAWAKETKWKRLFLHSLETRFTYELGGKKYDFAARAPIPSEFEAMV